MFIHQTFKNNALKDKMNKHLGTHTIAKKLFRGDCRVVMMFIFNSQHFKTPKKMQTTTNKKTKKNTHFL